MRIRYSKRFEFCFRRMSQGDKRAVIGAIDTFIDAPRHPSLNVHSLRGTMAGKKSLSVDHDLRIIFTVKGDYDEVLFLDIGAHADVYRK